MTKESSGSLKQDEKAVRLWFVVVLYAALTGVNFLFANYVKHIDVFNDEYFYVNAARNILRGEFPVIDGTTLNFDKILYSVIISPLYLIGDAALRVRMIALVNSAMMSASVFPIWLISRKIELGRKSTLIALGITCIFPELSMTMSFMSENLFFPLTLFFIYFWLVNREAPTKKNAVILGALAFLCYFCKASFLAVFVTCAGFEIVFPVISFLTRSKDDTRELKSFYSKARFIGLIIFIAVFVILNVILKATLFNGAESSYQVQSISTFFDNSYRLWYTVYGAVYMLAGIMISALILPFIYPALCYKSLGENARQLFCFTVMSILVTVAAVAYTIVPNEDRGLAMPRVHMRYFAHFVLIMLVIFLKSIETSYDSDGEKRPRYWAALGLASILPCMIYRGMGKGVPDQTLLCFYEDYRRNIGSIGLDTAQWLSYMKGGGYAWMECTDPISIDLYAIVFGIAAFAVIFLFHWLFTKGYEGYARIVIISVIAFVMASSSLNARQQWSDRNNDKLELAPEIFAVNEYLADSAGDFNILYITSADKRSNPMIKSVDTYLTLGKGRHIFVVDPEDVSAQILEQNGYSFEGLKLVNIHTTWGEPYAAEDTAGGFDYILTDKSSGIRSEQLSGVEKIALEGNDEFALYKNLDPKTLFIKPDSSAEYSGGELMVWSAEGGDRGGYITADYIVTDNGVSDINDVLAEVNVPVSEGITSVNVRVKLENTLDTYQLCMISSSESELLTAAVKGSEELCFSVVAEDGMISFEILLTSVKLDVLYYSGTDLFDTISCRVDSIEISDGK